MENNEKFFEKVARDRANSELAEILYRALKSNYYDEIILSGNEKIGAYNIQLVKKNIKPIELNELSLEELFKVTEYIMERGF